MKQVDNKTWDFYGAFTTAIDAVRSAANGNDTVISIGKPEEKKSDQSKPVTSLLAET